MKIAVIYGNERKGSTYNCVQIFKNALSRHGDIDFTEFYLPKDMPHFCKGCFTCFLHGEDKCPHSEAIQPIATAILESDGIVLASPVYALDVSGAMKAFLDHLCYMWMPHRPDEKMFSKVGYAISTTAGAGVGTANKTMTKSMNYWGMKRFYRFGFAVSAMKWDDVKEQKKIKITRRLEKDAKKFYNTVSRRKEIRPRIFTRIMFSMMRGMISGFEDGLRDKAYWEAKGWLDKKAKVTPFN